ncbi:DNA-3-methyladenine glycosylase I [Microbispora bryophytorum]|uniref:DNA-3-methyladenine glycosylase I n=1 Tax=Microbispora bryophytorum TaxID=1460882 RepID=A0A8H9H0J3_9ACTN|nr:DNA-3-methyladenine glycosylase I [Microbispora bryophytorum]MBD3136713.1 DNA-3-methyladenine glycosylase I [Microbispora bryophytorum]TQS06299.1 DNA-3-methyladenine glycosylase I [Microbispora bryophytorum]GGO17522.1 DNA-3-methyladenine glycosylase I [Microbispora bryophytorum]
MTGYDGLVRCGWAGTTPDYVAYHDEEWGRPVHGDDLVFERVTLEAFQSGLSWLTILRKRENFRKAFAGFSIPAVAVFDEGDVERLLGDAGIVRNRAKIEATVANARAALETPGGLSALVWKYAEEPGRVPATLADIPARTAGSTALAKELKKHGFRFVGPTTAYALMQAIGLVNDHVADCHVREAVTAQVAEAPTGLRSGASPC